jgi:hypothetical protein
MSRETPYSALDRAIHRLAFAGRAVQETAADMEAMLYGERFRHLTVERPIFVTSLPRAGTTLVLELLARVPGIATHNYRDMPFVRAPILWDVISRSFRKPSALRERAHGDGMVVGYDSPEAFEEVLWRSFWTEKYASDCIEPWTGDEDSSDFRELLVDHIRRIIAARAGDGPLPRYGSKNNANISRIALLRALFPDGVVLVPFRDPVDQALSLLDQHRRFAELHDRDAFAKRYMDDIGHLEFGALHKPIQFEGMNEVRLCYNPDTVDYWAAYWECTFQHVLSCRESIVLMSYDTLCEAGPLMMPALAERLSLSVGAMTEALGNRLRPPRQRADATFQDAALERRTRTLHEELMAASIGPRC